MVDAAVGGKTGVDVAAGKNLVGAFHHPWRVVVDPLVLDTLPRLQLREGLAEALKHGAILDEAYFGWIVSESAQLLSREPTAIERLVGRSLELKASIVAEDPHEAGRRAVLNFGHTIGHALELHTSFTLPHGVAVGIGMVAEAAAGERAGITVHGTTDRLRVGLERLDLPVALDPPSGSTADDVLADTLAALSLDKKARAAVPRFVLPAEVGCCARNPAGGWTHELPAAVLNAALREVIGDRGAV
jgi:3-dehydroquinate synthetase